MIAVFMPGTADCPPWIKAVATDAEVPPEGRVLGRSAGRWMAWNSQEDEALFHATRAQNRPTPAVTLNRAARRRLERAERRSTARAQ